VEQTLSQSRFGGGQDRGHLRPQLGPVCHALGIGPSGQFEKEYRLNLPGGKG
jgi:hypothetical protein